LFLLTLLWHDWIEAFGFDPDHHSGLLEWSIVVTFLAMAMVSGTLARLEWLRPLKLSPTR
jgi:hypothetical protein